MTSDGIDVETDTVSKFGSQTLREGKSFMRGSMQAMQALASQVGKIGSTFQEAEQFTKLHTQGMQKLMAFNGEANLGLTDLGMGAQAISKSYVDGDNSSAATQDEVRKVFDATGVRNLPQENGGPGAQQGGGAKPSSLPTPQTGSSENACPTTPLTPAQIAAQDIRETINQQQSSPDGWG